MFARRKSGLTDSKPLRLFPVEPDEPEEVACGLLGLGQGQGVGRAEPALPAPSQVPPNARPVPSAPFHRAWSKQLLVSHVMFLYGHKRAPHTASHSETSLPEDS